MKKEKTTKENLQLEETLPGFRKGITKKDLIKSLTKDDWLRIEKTKAAEELYEENKIAYWFYIRTDQARQECGVVQETILQSTSQILQFYNQEKRHRIDIEKGETTLTNEAGQQLTIDDLKAEILQLQSDAKKARRILIAAANKLYTFKNTLGFDKKPFFTQQQYEELINDVATDLSQTPYAIL